MGPRHCSTLIAIVLATASPSIESGLPKPTSTTEPTVTTGPRAWALATTAFLSYRNGDRRDMLPPEVRADSSVANTRSILHEWWRVDTRRDLLQTLDRLDAGGHRAVFQQKGQSLLAMTDTQFQAALAEAHKRPHDVRRMKLVREYYKKHRGDSFLAWDYCRYIMLCRWGYHVGFLTREEAWGRMMPAARKIQAGFRSWSELGDDYLVGRELWSPEETEKTGKYYRDLEVWLVKDPRSEWNLLPWAMNLGDPTPR